jgi:chromosome segregation ATPase
MTRLCGQLEEAWQEASRHGAAVSSLTHDRDASRALHAAADAEIYRLQSHIQGLESRSNGQDGRIASLEAAQAEQNLSLGRMQRRIGELEALTTLQQQQLLQRDAGAVGAWGYKQQADLATAEVARLNQAARLADATIYDLRRQVEQLTLAAGTLAPRPGAGAGPSATDPRPDTPAYPPPPVGRPPREAYGSRWDSPQPRSVPASSTGGNPTPSS